MCWSIVICHFLCTMFLYAEVMGWNILMNCWENLYFYVISNEIGGITSGTLLLAFRHTHYFVGVTDHFSFHFFYKDLENINFYIPKNQIIFYGPCSWNKIFFCYQHPTCILIVVDFSLDTIQEGSCQCEM